MIERLCRIGAIAIAVLAVIDPAWVVARSATPRVVLRQSGGATPDDVARVSEALQGNFVVDAEVSPDTAVHLIVGRQVPSRPAEGLTFAVVPPMPPAAPEIRGLRLNDRMPLTAIGRVSVEVALPAVMPDVLRVSLLVDGVPVDSQTVTVEPGATRATGDLRFVPSRLGLARLRVSAGFGDGPGTFVDGAVEVVERTLRVLLYEARPSWAATFVRRALEGDPRFEVVVRSITSRGVAVDAGAPPATIERAEELSGFDVVLVSAPEAVGDRAAAALESYLRVREGAVVLLPDGDAPLLSRLTGVSSWFGERTPELERVEFTSGAWTASEFLWPGTWPPGAEPATSCLAGPGTARRCPVWRMPVGGGRVVVSSALDGWRTRATDASSFQAFWRSLVGDEAATTPRPVEVSLQTRLVEAGTRTRADVRAIGPGIRDAESLRAELQWTDGAVQPIRLWPGAAGHHQAEFRAPDVPGRYRLVVGPASAEFVVVDSGAVQPPLPGSDAALALFAASRGGQAVAMADLDSLPARIAGVIGAAPEDTTTRPMRSSWWMVPFAGLLAFEWWSRRRRGAR